MSKLFLKILLCTGFGFGAFPVSSMEKGEQGTAPEGKKPLESSFREESAAPSIAQPSSAESKFLASLESAQKEVQQTALKKSTVPTTLDAESVSLILSQPYINMISDPRNPGKFIQRGSTQAVSLNKGGTLLVSAKFPTDEPYVAVRKAVHPTYVDLWLKGADDAEKIRVFKDLLIDDKKPTDVHPAISTKVVAMVQSDNDRGATATAQHEKGHKNATSDSDKHQIMIGDIPLKYPVEQYSIGKTSGSYNFADAILTLNFTFDKERKKKEKVKKGSDLASLQSLALSLPDKPKWLVDLNYGEAKEPVSQSPTQSLPDSKGKKRGEKEKKPKSKVERQIKDKSHPVSKKHKGKGLQPVLSPTAPLSSGATRPVSSALSQFEKDIAATQATVETTAQSIPDTLDMKQIFRILLSPHDSVRQSTEAISIGETKGGDDIKASIKSTNLNPLIAALCDLYDIPLTKFSALPEKQMVDLQPILNAHLKELLQPTYKGSTFLSAESSGFTADGTLAKYELHLAGSETPYQFPTSEGHTSTRKLELSITIIEKKNTEKAITEKTITEEEEASH